MKTHNKTPLEQMKSKLEEHGVLYNEEERIFNTYKMSERETNAVLEGLEEIKSGDVLSHSNVMEETKKRYPKLFADGSLV